MSLIIGLLFIPVVLHPILEPIVTRWTMRDCFKED